jgi:hypothetical protein
MQTVLWMAILGFLFGIMSAAFCPIDGARGIELLNYLNMPAILLGGLVRGEISWIITPILIIIQWTLIGAALAITRVVCKHR